MAKTGSATTIMSTNAHHRRSRSAIATGPAGSTTAERIRSHPESPIATATSMTARTARVPALRMFDVISPPLNADQPGPAPQGAVPTPGNHLDHLSSSFLSTLLSKLRAPRCFIGFRQMLRAHQLHQWFIKSYLGMVAIMSRGGVTLSRPRPGGAPASGMVSRHLRRANKIGPTRLSFCQVRQYPRINKAPITSFWAYPPR